MNYPKNAPTLSLKALLPMSDTITTTLKPTVLPGIFYHRVVLLIRQPSKLTPRPLPLSINWKLPRCCPTGAEPGSQWDASTRPCTLLSKTLSKSDQQTWQPTITMSPLLISTWEELNWSAVLTTRLWSIFSATCKSGTHDLKKRTSMSTAISRTITTTTTILGPNLIQPRVLFTFFKSKTTEKTTKYRKISFGASAPFKKNAKI
mmetsp:Transcript_9616/g.20836  ORF Transcript_9616/g.20836 Transcript_9616/m.20836 type:complete len:204 (+) Transcript_9616:733-1344(+)